MSNIELRWLPDVADWRERLKVAEQAPPGAVTWAELVSLAKARMDFLRTDRLDKLLRRTFPEPPSLGGQAGPARLAILASSTVAHLQSSIRVAALRRGMGLTVYEGPYGQYRQELLNPDSGLHSFRPNFVLFALGSGLID